MGGHRGTGCDDRLDVVFFDQLYGFSIGIFIHPFRASGKKKFPLIKRATFCLKRGFPSLTKPL